MSRDTTGRSMEHPEGHRRRPVVSEGNCQVARMVLILMLMVAGNKHWLLEQPGTSIMRWSKWMKFLRAIQRVWHWRTWMCMFGTSTAKPTQIDSSSFWTSKLIRQKRNMDDRLDPTHGVQHESPDHTGRIRVTGHSGLKESQQYTPEFGSAVLTAYLEGADEHITWDCEDIADGDMWNAWRAARANYPISWEAARLGEVAEFLGVPENLPVTSA